jgi:hypothetical protein
MILGFVSNFDDMFSTPVWKVDKRYIMKVIAATPLLGSPDIVNQSLKKPPL